MNQRQMIIDEALKAIRESARDKQWLNNKQNPIASSGVASGRSSRLKTESDQPEIGAQHATNGQIVHLLEPLTRSLAHSQAQRKVNISRPYSQSVLML